jgi:ribonuclease Z
MDIILLGTGGPKPDPHRQGPCVAIRSQGQYLIFDTGRGAATQMAAAHIPMDKMGPVFITHHHYDHIGNLGDVILSSWNLGRKKELFIYGPKGTKDITDTLLDRVYKNDINFRMTESTLTGVELVNIHDIVRPEDIEPGLIYEDDVFKVYCEYVSHGHGLGISQNSWKCLGYRVEADNMSVTISGDCVDCKGLDLLAKDTNVLVQCCYLSQKETTGSEGAIIADHILTCSDRAGKIARKAGAKKLVLTHIREKTAQQINNLVQEIKKEFFGEVIAGQDLLVIGSEQKITI